MGYCKKIHWNIQRELSSQDFLTSKLRLYSKGKVKIKQINNN